MAGTSCRGERSGYSPLASKARSVFLSNMVKGINCPRLFGIPSGTGLQKYAGINEPFVKAWMGAMAARPSRDRVTGCIV